jgi:hypothetical protein
MVLILEIVLTVVAWRKGWRGWALLPIGILLLMGFSTGVLLGAAGYSEAQIREFMRAAVILDFPGIGVLIWMAARGRRGILANGSAKELESAQVVTSKI